LAVSLQTRNSAWAGVVAAIAMKPAKPASRRVEPRRIEFTIAPEITEKRALL
jgi:hypothetical protein